MNPFTHYVEETDLNKVSLATTQAATEAIEANKEMLDELLAMRYPLEELIRKLADSDKIRIPIITAYKEVYKQHYGIDVEGDPLLQKAIEYEVLAVIRRVIGH